MNALIDPTTSVQHVVGWDVDRNPILETYPNSARVCETSANPFEVAPPLFWTPCADNIVADQFWYSTTDATFSPVENVPPPPLQDPVATGVQTL